MELYVVTINGQSQRLVDHGLFLAGCTKNPTLFTHIGFAEQAARKTLRYAEDKGYSNWSIVQAGYEIQSLQLKLVSHESKSVGAL